MPRGDRPEPHAPRERLRLHPQSAGAAPAERRLDPIEPNSAEQRCAEERLHYLGAWRLCWIERPTNVVHSPSSKFMPVDETDHFCFDGHRITENSKWSFSVTYSRNQLDIRYVVHRFVHTSRNTAILCAISNISKIPLST